MFRCGIIAVYVVIAVERKSLQNSESGFDSCSPRLFLQQTKGVLVNISIPEHTEMYKNLKKHADEEGTSIPGMLELCASIGCAIFDSWNYDAWNVVISYTNIQQELKKIRQIDRDLGR